MNEFLVWLAVASLILAVFAWSFAPFIQAVRANRKLRGKKGKGAT